jgi:YhcH/YjgK/YiaL family protein
LDGEALFAIVDAGALEEPSARRFESHRRYLDIQCVWSPERMQVTPLAGLTVADPFTTDGDLAFYQEPQRAVQDFCLAPRELAIFWPEDAHKPCCRVTGDGAFRKVVVKVRIAP